MSATMVVRTVLLSALCVVIVSPVAGAQPNPARPWVYEAPKAPKRASSEPRRPVELGALQKMTPASRNAVLSRVGGDRVHDLRVQYFIGLPSWYAADVLPPIVARGVLIDVAGLRNVPVLPDAYRITRGDLEEALAAQGVSLHDGDIVLVRGGKIALEAAQWLAESNGAMVIGGDALSLETYKYGRPDLTVPVHNYLLNQRGIAIIQVENLEELAKARLYEFAFIAAALRPGGGAGLVFAPLAFPLRPER